MKGEVRNPTTVWILSLVTCGLYGLYWFYLIGNELKNYLGKEDLNPTTDIIITLVCSVYALYLPIKYGKLVFEAQQRAGIPDATDQGIKFLLMNFLCLGLGYMMLQKELNRVWEAGGGAPQTF